MLPNVLQRKVWGHEINTFLIFLLIVAERIQSTCIYNVDEYCEIHPGLITSLDESKVCYAILEDGKHLPGKHVTCKMKFDGGGFDNDRFKICFQMKELDIDNCGIWIEFSEETVWKGNTGSSASRPFSCHGSNWYDKWCTDTGVNGYISFFEHRTSNSSFRIEVTAESTTVDSDAIIIGCVVGGIVLGIIIVIIVIVCVRRYINNTSEMRLFHAALNAARAHEMEMNSNPTRNATAQPNASSQEMPGDSQNLMTGYRQNNMPNYRNGQDAAKKGAFTYDQPPPSYDDVMHGQNI